MLNLHIKLLCKGKKCTTISHKRLSRHILQLIHKKAYTWRRSKLIPSADNIQKFKLCSSSLRTAIKAHRLNRDTADLCGVSSKHFYNIVSKRMYPSRESFPLVDNNDNPIYSDIVKAELFINAFMQNFSTDPYIATTPSFANGFSINIVVEIILKHLRQLSCSAAASDVINNVFLHGAASGLVQPLTVIFQRSIFEAKIPDAWRVAKVLLLYKGKGLKCDLNSFRSISITSCACKFLEKIVKDLSITYLSSENAPSQMQHGFRPKRSTVTNLLSIKSYIINAINNDIPVDMILLDFYSAFDKVPHNKLIDA